MSRCVTRGSGILMPFFSLPGKYGIGTFSKEAYRFVDFLVDAGQKYWQILPLGPTGFGDSPYQSFSTFAGNPYFISLETLVERGLLTKKECEHCDFGKNASKIDYEKLYLNRISLLEKAAERFFASERKSVSYEEFLKENDFWLRDYALFMTLKETFRGKPLEEWEDSYRKHEKAVLSEFEKKHEKRIRLYYYIQYEFYREWKALKSYANRKGVEIIGDIPIYVSADGADIWGCPEAFQTDADRRVTAVAGCPPDSFAKDGQLWGNPLYNWEYHKKTGYDWWVRRFEKCLDLYDVIRIDHFRGFDEYYSIPADSDTAAVGEWRKGPGLELFTALEERLGEMPIIAEDLGYMTDSVRKLVRDTGFPNMKVLQFAFDSRTATEGGINEYLPHFYDKNSVVYTGTHDNETIMGYLQGMNPEDKGFLRAYFGVSEHCSDKKLAQMLLRLALASVSDYCIIPMVDYLFLDNSARTNEPATTGDNWNFRMKQGMFDRKLAKNIRKLTKLYGRG
ncbi:MAG: 4-alpha-glucanotransferase [Lachnospiraceae bacterium]|nr:4-alpha-glucanotransferase [Lachnospiraceae bacterium]